MVIPLIVLSLCKSSLSTILPFGEDNEFLSGIKEVYIYLVDKDSNNIYQITKDGTMELISSLDEISAIPVSELDDIKDDTNDITRKSLFWV